MHHHPYEIEINAAYARERVTAIAAANRQASTAQRAERVPSPPPTFGWLRCGLGRRLIAAGERLAGSSVCPPATLGPAA